MNLKDHQTSRVDLKEAAAYVKLKDEQTSHGDLFQPQGTCSQPKNLVNPVCIFVGNKNLQKVIGCNG